MAAWNMSEVILAEGLAELGAEDPPASDLMFENTCCGNGLQQDKPSSCWSKSSYTLEPLKALRSTST